MFTGIFIGFSLGFVIGIIIGTAGWRTIKNNLTKIELLTPGHCAGCFHHQSFHANPIGCRKYPCYCREFYPHNKLNEPARKLERKDLKKFKDLLKGIE